jgi:hypothetical protein
MSYCFSIKKIRIENQFKSKKGLAANLDAVGRKKNTLK